MAGAPRPGRPPAALLRAGGLLVVLALLASCGGPGPSPRPTQPRTTLGAPSTTAPSTSTSAPGSTSTTRAPSTTVRPATTVPVTTTTAPAVSRLAGRVWNQIPTTAHVVALTFDAGANADGVPAIVNTLAAGGVPASFFLTGAFTQQFPDQARRIAGGGYRIGDHSVDHPHFPALTDAQVRQEVLGAATTIRSVTGRDPAPLFRFPYGDSDARTLADVNGLGYVAVGWTVDTLGWEGTSAGVTPASIVSRVLSRLGPGEIVLMHVGSNPDDHSTLDAAALPQVVAAVEQAGYSFVTLDALLGG